MRTIVKSCVWVKFFIRQPIGITQQTKITKPVLSVRQAAILSIIEKHRVITLKQLANELENPPSERMIRSDLDSLRRKSLIDYQGSARSTLWVLKK